MRKIIFMLLLSLATVTAWSEGVVNGDFSAGSFGGVSSGISGTYAGIVNQGWYTNSTYSYIAGGEAVRTAAGGGSIGGIGQFFTCTNNGTAELKFDVQLTDADGDVKLYVQLFGYNQTNNASTTITANGDALSIIKTNAPMDQTGSANYEYTPLVDYQRLSGGTLNGGNYATITNSFIASTNYEIYGIRLISNHPDAGDVVMFDNVTIGAGAGPAPVKATTFIFR